MPTAKLLTKLVGALSDVLPAGFELRTASDSLILYHEATVQLSIDFTDMDADPDLIAARIGNALGSIQDGIARLTRRPWPSAEGRSRSHIPLSNAIVRDGAIKWWYGDEQNP